MGYSFGKRPVDSKSEITLIYRTKSGKTVKDSLLKGQKAFLLQEGPNFSKIKTEKNVVGWVNNSQISYTKSGKGDIYQLSNQDIVGWLDNPAALYILDEGNVGSDAVLLSRSFSHEFFEFIDREDMERSNDEN